MKSTVVGLGMGLLAMSSMIGIAAEGDAKAGKGVFGRCAGCHFYNREKKKVGPHLVDIVGRKVGIVEDYKYSNALKKIAEGALIWDEKLLNEYLTDPLKFTKERGGKAGKMRLKLKDEQNRADVIAFLKAEAKVK